MYKRQVKDVVMVEGKPVEMIYPKVYLKQSNRLQLHTDGTLISANTLVMNAKKRIHNEGVIQGKTVVLASDQDIINSGHINADKVGLQSDTTIYQQGQIVGRDAVELQAKENITFNNSIEHLTNQDVLHKTAGIAVTLSLIHISSCGFAILIIQQVPMSLLKISANL